ncbi:MAG: hypothetical protein AUF67_10050 [Acidobacteria bacterium 13_1_20CM_58_21]|nr:MAG: hypothetical protein AUF67_10050 [Acidobacteria bacterium 13_1_20CM_58_21]
MQERETNNTGRQLIYSPLLGVFHDADDLKLPYVLIHAKTDGLAKRPLHAILFTEKVVRKRFLDDCGIAA